MTWSSMRGRPRDLPIDRTPLRGARVDARARVAWLVRVSRMASPVGGTGADFSRRLTNSDFPVGASALSRREHGQEGISGAMLSAYERVLKLPSGHLRGVCESLRRLGAVDPVDQPEPMDRQVLSVQLSRLERRVTAHEATASDWLQLSHMLVQHAGVVLPPSVLDCWVRQLLIEMLRSVGTSYVGRYEALALLMSDPVTRSNVTDVVLETVQTPGAGCVMDALSVLGETNDPATVDRVVDLFAHGRHRVRVGAARALLQQVVLGALSVDQVNRVQRAVLSVARDDPDDGGWPAFLLAQRISLQLTRMVVALLGSNPGDRPQGAYIQDPAELQTYLHAAARHSGVQGDEMLERLVREALTDDFLERRHHSSLMLMASPYRSTLADTAIEMVRTTADPVARDAAGQLLTYLAGTEHRGRLLDLLDGAEIEQQRVALHSLAHAGGVPSSVDLHSRLVQPELRWSATYAAGMSAHPVLRSSASLGELDDKVRASIEWWLQVGPAVLDVPGTDVDARRVSRLSAHVRTSMPDHDAESKVSLGSRAEAVV